MDSFILLAETKKRDDLKSDEVVAKAAAAVRWCKYAAGHTKNVGGKPWKYMLIPHDEISESKRLTDYLRFEQRRSEEHTSELQSLMRISYAVFCLKQKIHYIEYSDTHVLSLAVSHS